jgi:hypothetical protein
MYFEGHFHDENDYIVKSEKIYNDTDFAMVIKNNDVLLALRNTEYFNVTDICKRNYANVHIFIKMQETKINAIKLSKIVGVPALININKNNIANKKNSILYTGYYAHSGLLLHVLRYCDPILTLKYTMMMTKKNLENDYERLFYSAWCKINEQLSETRYSKKKFLKKTIKKILQGKSCINLNMTHNKIDIIAGNDIVYVAPFEEYKSYITELINLNSTPEMNKCLYLYDVDSQNEEKIKNLCKCNYIKLKYIQTTQNTLELIDIF